MENPAKLNQGSTMTSDQLVIARGEGVYLWDIKGNRYLDLISQTWSLPLGHNHPQVIAAATRQLQSLSHLRTAFVTESALRLANRITGLAPRGLNKVSFVLHGSLAVEGALKLALNRHPDRTNILYLEDGFHGRSLGTMGVSWKPAYRSYDGYFAHSIEVRKDLADVEAKMAAESPAAIIIELVQGNSGFLVLEKDFVRGVRALADRYGVTLIVDEVQTAFGCVETTFLSEQYGLVPDILVFGKALGGGLPIAGAVFKDEYAFKPGDHSFTFACNPVCIAAAEAYIEQMLPCLPLIPAVNRLLAGHLDRLVAKYPICVRPRTIGLKAAFDLVDERGIPDPDTASAIVSRMLERGIIISVSRYGTVGHAVMLQPPLIITSAELAAAFAALDDVLGAMCGHAAAELAPVAVRKFGGKVLALVASAPLQGSTRHKLDWRKEFGWAPSDPRVISSADDPSASRSGDAVHATRFQLSPGQPVAIQYRPDARFGDGVQRTILHVEQGSLRLLLCERSGDGLQAVELRAGQFAYVLAPYGLVAQAPQTIVRQYTPHSAGDPISLLEAASLDDLYMSPERRQVLLSEPVSPGILAREIDRALDERQGRMRVNGDPIFRYRHSSRDENDVFCAEHGVWYRFSFVSGRAEYDRDIPSSEVPAAHSVHVIADHQTPSDRPCPFCIDEMAPRRAAEETLFSTSLASGEIPYAFLLNRNAYAERHLCLIATRKRPQILCRSTIRDALLYAQALGASYEGGFNSLGAATVRHFHLSFYQTKSPIWRNLREGLVYPVNVGSHGQAVVGDLSPNWTRTRMYAGSNLADLVEAVYLEIADLQKKDVLHTCKFRFQEDGSFIWLTCPRKSGYMTHVKHLLEPENAAPPALVNTCGSVEAPGGEAIMFMAQPRVLSASQRVRMALRFRAAIDEGSQRDWSPPLSAPMPFLTRSRPSATHFRRHTPLPGHPARIAHRVDSPESAKRSAAEGFDFMEMDVQMTKDNELLAFWGLVANRYDVFSLNRSQIESLTGRRPVRIEELLDAAGPGMGVCFDVKDWADGAYGYMDAVLERLARLIQEYDLSDRAIVESFNIQYLLRAAELIPLHRSRACTALAIPRARASIAMRQDIGRAHHASASGLFVYPEDLSHPVIDQIHDLGMAVMTHREGLNEQFLELVQLTAEDVSLGR